MSNRFLIAAALTFLAAAQIRIGIDELTVRLAPYTPASAAGLIRTQVELVEVPVVVRDGKGRAVSGLKREDFEVFDSGKKREISAFSVENFAHTVAVPAPSPTPAATPQAAPETPRRFIAVVIDDLNSDFASLRYGKTAAEKFVADSLAPGDLVGIFRTASSQSVAFTADVQKLRKEIEQINPRPRYSDELQSCPSIRAYEAYLIDAHLDRDLLRAKAGELVVCNRMRLEDAERVVEGMARGIFEHVRMNTANTLGTVASIVSSMAKMPGQRLVLLTSSGFVTAQEEDRLESLGSLALHSGVVISTMDLRGLYTIIPGGDASTPTRGRSNSIAEIRVQSRVEDSKADGLGILASATGGQYFHNNNDLTAGFRRLGAVPEVLYVLGFPAGDVVHDGKYHALRVRLVNGRHGNVQARMGYTAQPKEPPAEQVREHERDRIVTGTEARAEVVGRIAAEIRQSDTGPFAAVRATIDIGRLNFDTKQDRRAQTLTVIAALFDGNGNFVIGQQAHAQLSLRDASYQALVPAGLPVDLTLRAPAGKYNLRVFVQEELTGKLSTVTRAIEIQ